MGPPRDGCIGEMFNIGTEWVTRQITSLTYGNCGGRASSWSNDVCWIWPKRATDLRYALLATEIARRCKCRGWDGPAALPPPKGLRECGGFNMKRSDANGLVKKDLLALVRLVKRLSQQDAKRAGRGLWAGSYVEPWQFPTCIKGRRKA
jgi:hypothetical protein